MESGSLGESRVRVLGMGGIGGSPAEEKSAGRVFVLGAAGQRKRPTKVNAPQIAAIHRHLNRSIVSLVPEGERISVEKQLVELLSSSQHPSVHRRVRTCLGIIAG